MIQQLIDITFLEISLNHDIDILLSWLSRNDLMVNNIKSQAMMIGDIAYDPQFIFGDSRVELSNSLKILGVIIDDKLTFADHTQCYKRSLCQDWCPIAL